MIKISTQNYQNNQFIYYKNIQTFIKPKTKNYLTNNNQRCFKCFFIQNSFFNFFFNSFLLYSCINKTKSNAFIIKTYRPKAASALRAVRNKIKIKLSAIHGMMRPYHANNNQRYHYNA